MLPNVQQKTIKPIIEEVVTKGSQLYTDEYDIYDRLPVWGYKHQTVCHSKGEYARDEACPWALVPRDGDGFHEIHVNTMEGFWSLLRSWLRPHRGISQEKLPIYRKRCSATLGPFRRFRALVAAPSATASIHRCASVASRSRGVSAGR